MKPVPYFAACATLLAAIAIYVEFFSGLSGPIMMCDPATLKYGDSQEEVLAACGKPRRTAEDLKSTPWYPLLGEKREKREEIREDTWIYGDIFDKTRNVNLYFTGGKLRSVQIYGDYK